MSRKSKTHGLFRSTDLKGHIGSFLNAEETRNWINANSTCAPDSAAACGECTESERALYIKGMAYWIEYPWLQCMGQCGGKRCLRQGMYKEDGSIWDGIHDTSRDLTQFGPEVLYCSAHKQENESKVSPWIQNSLDSFTRARRMKVEELEQKVTKCQNALFDRGVKLQKAEDEIKSQQFILDTLTSQIAELQSEVELHRIGEIAQLRVRR